MNKILKLALLFTTLSLLLLLAGESFAQTSNQRIKRITKKRNYDKSNIATLPTQYFEVGGMQFVTKSFILKEKGQENIYLGEEQVQEIFFTLVLLTDRLDQMTEKQELDFLESGISSNFLFKGTINTRNQKIDYLAKLNCQQDYSAIIGDQKFDLHEGQTILIAPQKDESLQFIQLKSPGLNSLTATTYVDKLLTKAKVLHFFKQSGNI